MICNLTKHKIISGKTVYANSFPIRLRGMIGRTFSGFDAMVFPQCSCVHTFFMSFELDLVFLTGDNIIKKTVSEAKPWRPCFSCDGASSVIELPPGTIRETGSEIGDILDLNAEWNEDLQKEWDQIYRKNSAGSTVLPIGEK